MANMIRSVLGSVAALFQTKEVTASTSDMTVTPDSGIDGISSITIHPTPSTSITPSNSSPASMTSGTRYTPSASGYAISSYSSVTPSSSPTTLSSGSVYKMGGSGYAINSYSSSNKTATSDGASYSAGWNYMTNSGYAYNPKPSTGMTRTTLWTNPDSTVKFETNPVTLTNGKFSDYTFIEIEYKFHKDTDTRSSVMFKVSDYIASKFTNSYSSTENHMCMYMAVRVWSSWPTGRGLAYDSDTSIKIGHSYRIATGSSTAQVTSQTVDEHCIPTNIYGWK